MSSRCWSGHEKIAQPVSTAVFYRHSVPAAGRDTGYLVVQVFADQLDAWMEEFHGLLNFQTAALPESDPEKETLPDAVCCCRAYRHFLFFFYSLGFARCYWAEARGLLP